jgi:serine/threonine-protein kinase
MTQPKICPTCGNSYDAANLFCPLDRAPLRSAAEPGALVGCLIAGRYLVASRIGLGGMGEVYRAQDVRLQRPVAIKVLHDSLIGDVDALARFNREAANCSKINNQHVVQVYDFGETEEGLPYLAMEFVQGRSLKAVIDSEGPFAPDRVAGIVAQIASGLDVAHRLDCPVIHRDLKPDNVLVTKNPEGGELVKVADFGISKAMRDNTQQVTKTGFVAGTYEYMSPEQVTGGAVDQRSDVYALGLIAFLMLTGKLPFAGQTPEHSMLLRLNEAPSTLRAMRSEVPWSDVMQRVMDKALARDPGERYGSAKQFAKDLARAIQPEEQPVGPAAGRRRRPAVWMAVALVLLGVAGAGAALFRHWPVGGETASIRQPADFGIPLNPDLGDSSMAEGVDSSTAFLNPSAAEAAQRPPAVSGIDTAKQQIDSVQSRTAPPSSAKRPARAAKPRLAAPPSVSPAPLGLEQYDAILHPDMPRDSALRALASLNALIPRLKTARDSVEADLYRAEATALSGQPEEACAILERARSRATELQRRKIELWADQGICTAPDWRSS